MKRSANAPAALAAPRLRNGGQASLFALALFALVLSWLALVAPATAATTHTYVGQLGGTGSAPGGFLNPQGVAFDSSNGDLLVADEWNGRVQELTSAGEPVAQWKGLVAPHGVAVDAANNRAYVSEQWVNRVQVFETSTGTSLGYLETGVGWGSVSGVAVDASSGAVYVADFVNNVVQVFDAAGAHLGSFGSAGSDPGQFSGPTSVGVDPASHDVYVIDSGNNRVEKFSAEGASYLGALSEAASPIVLAVDPSNGDVYVCEGAPSMHIARYDSSGTFLYSFGSQNLSSVGGLATSATGHRVYASDPNANAVKIFAPITVATVTTEGTENTTATSATLKGAVNPEGSTVYYEYFQYGLDTSYGGMAYGNEWFFTGNATILVSAEAAPLEPNATYHYRLVANTDAGEFFGADQTFKTAPAPPAIDGTSATAGVEGAVVHAEVNPNNTETFYRVEYGTTSAYGTSVASASAGSGYGDTEVSAELSGLAPDTVYHYRVIAENGVGSPVESADEAFKTAPAQAPGAAEVTGISATLTGMADVQGSGTYHFEYGTDTTYGSQTPEAPAQPIVGDQPLSASVTGLQPGTTYHFRLVSSAGGDTTQGPDGTFTTLQAPAVVTGEATGVGSSSAALHGTVDTHGSPGVYHFRVTGLESTVDRATPDQQIASDGPAQAAGAIAELPSGDAYRVVLVATVGGVTVYGEPTTFTTPPAPAPTTRAPASNSHPFGCAAPHLDQPALPGVAGSPFTLTGSDLGIGGRLTINGVAHNRTEAWSAAAVTFTLPRNASGKLTVSLDCGTASNAVLVRVSPGGSAAHKPRRHAKHRRRHGRAGRKGHHR